MKYTLLDKQKDIAMENYNYFLIKIVFKVLFIFFKISILLIVNQFFNSIILSLLCIFFIILSIYSMFYNIKKYYYILNDIKKTLNYTETYIIIDFKSYSIKKIFSYSK